MSTKKHSFLDAVDDAVSDLCYYDRNGDEELTSQDVRELIESGEVTVDEIAEAVKKAIRENFEVPG